MDNDGVDALGAIFALLILLLAVTGAALIFYFTTHS